MATLLTSNVTNSASMVVSFLFCIVYLFAVFFLYFRALYWAIRQESNVLYIWFYIFSVVLWAFFAYVIAEAISLVSILAEPLAPGSQLPVKVNPILPVALFSIVVLMFVFACLLVFYYFSCAFYWQRLSDKEKLDLYKKQKKKKWLSNWFGGGGIDQDDYVSEGEDGEARYIYSCILEYEKAKEDYIDDVSLEREDPKKKKKKKKKAKPKTNPGGTRRFELLTVPGKVHVYPELRKIIFKADEAIFSNVFKLTIMMLNVNSLKSRGDNRMYMVEQLSDEALPDERDLFTTVPATCGRPEMTIRVLRFEFDTKGNRDDCMKNVKKYWSKAKKNMKVFHARDEESLRELRLRMIRKTKQRAQQHLLTHQDWKLLVSQVLRKDYKAGDIILPKGSWFNEIMQIGKGSVEIYLQTSTGFEQAAKGMTAGASLPGSPSHLPVGNDFDLQSLLFPVVNAEHKFEDLPTPVASHPTVQGVRPSYYTVRFEKRSLGLSFRNTKRQYLLSEFEGDGTPNVDTGNEWAGIGPKPDDNNIASIVRSVTAGSPAAKLGVEKGDELVKVGLYNVEQNQLSQKSIKNLIKNHSYPMQLTFRRPPRMKFATDAAGFITPDSAFVSTDVRDKMILEAEDDEDDEDEEQFAKVVLEPIAAPPKAPGADEDTSDEESSEEEEVDLLDFSSGVTKFDAFPSSPPQESFAMERLELAEEFAEKENNNPNSGADDTIEFLPSAPPKPAPIQTAPGMVSFEISRGRDSDEISLHEGEEGNTGNDGLISRGRKWLFGTPVEYNELKEREIRSRVKPLDDDDEEDAISILVDDSDETSESSDDEAEDLFRGIPTYEPVGEFLERDTLGIIPWILNQPVSVVQLNAKTDVTIFSIKIENLTKLFKKNGTLALAFFKYVAAVIGERADRDEELLCDQILRTPAPSRTESLQRLLDNKPIRTTEMTNFERRSIATEKARDGFEKDFDMQFDTVIFEEPCTVEIIGAVDVRVGKTWQADVGAAWKGVDTQSKYKFAEPKRGTLFVTHFYVCFRSDKRAMDLLKMKRRPVFYGKLHINDIFEMRRSGVEGEVLTILTDDYRFDCSFTNAKQAAIVEGWLWCFIQSGSVVERAPNSYTLPGDIFAATPEDEQCFDEVDGLKIEVSDPLNILYTQQRKLRTEFLILTQTLQQVFNKQDRYRMFHNGRSVVLKRGQNVVSASHHLGHKIRSDDPDYNRRTGTSRKAISLDGPSGLYLLGKGEVVVQREVKGRRIQFACYKEGMVFGVERFLTGAPSPFTIKVSSEAALLKFAPRERCMALLRSDLSLAARFYQYCALLQMQRLRGPILSRPEDDEDTKNVANTGKTSKDCVIL
eukprot:CAMPEP_0203764208 /NCGR_PEP_ID=MMETSP0098-20131031/17514_1 /ASSEMBLY_ACC=CAM_ASM_000208 /TAXON_ID=96639 /ORGANISM=" , Strain NY0313808BC1" /LENGTH=1340 /DNA_ID=CAMNT_0050659959 /DNA_START=582 /DNA_END=4604 /DNA_ORIENTATION=+